MEGKTTNQTQHADCFTSDTPVSAPSIPPVFPFDRTVVPINSVSLTIISMSSANNSVNDSVFSVPGTSIRAASAIIVMLQRTISQPHTIIDATPAIIFSSQIIVFEVQIRISKRKAISSERIAVIGGLHMIIDGPDSIIYIREAMMSIVDTTISTAQTDFPKGDTVISTLPTSFFAAEVI